MNRDVGIVVITDTNSEECRSLLSQISQTTIMPKAILTPMAVRNLIPCIRATPAVGVLFWATDLQGLVTDIDSFTQYIRDEAVNKQALADAAELAAAELAAELGEVQS